MTSIKTRAIRRKLNLSIRDVANYLDLPIPTYVYYEIRGINRADYLVYAKLIYMFVEIYNKQ